ncbi:hypothetical protein Csa_017525 [Cucumis sativus]|uniref:Uncharacterized protein n=1 Tax=Cucumis sativus TaxID=3659 RepID=A0A0A0LC70_CUCSA|nr:hypothetical protein Csa_017525 [Cucumis sativus]
MFDRSLNVHDSGGDRWTGQRRNGEILDGFGEIWIQRIQDNANQRDVEEYEGLKAKSQDEI